MDVCILMASPRKNGNTAALLEPIEKVFTDGQADCHVYRLYDKRIESCIACRVCQKDWGNFGCVWDDDVQELFDAVLECDLILLATPIYSWYCTPPMKALLDRLVYGMNKYYGEEKGPSLWSGKELAIVTTCGYRPEKGADLWEEGIRRYCKHSGLVYRGMLAERHKGYHTTFLDASKVERAQAFASMLMGSHKE